MEEREKKTDAGRINLRPFLFCALGLFFGITLYFQIAFERFVLSDFLFYAIFAVLALVPFSRRRVVFVIAVLVLGAGIGAAVGYGFRARYFGGTEGETVVMGTVRSCVGKDGYSEAILGDLSIGGERTGGKMLVRFSSEDAHVGDVVVFEGKVEHADEEGSYGDYLFSENIRYVSAGAYVRTGRSKNFLLRLDDRLYCTLRAGMGTEQAEVAYALLTGNSQIMDGGLLDSVRRGGIAHIFAVSGLHIGILYGAVYLLCRPFGRWACAPSSAAAFLYAAFCAFTPSSVRAAVMCTSLGVCRAVGVKYDFLESVSLAAILILLFSPAAARSVGFLLSFGACIGLALYGGTLRRAFRKLPAFLRDYLAAAVSVQTLTLPVAFSSFGYLAVWGLALNLFLLPALPVLFLTTLVCSLAAASFSAPALLIVPDGLMSLFLMLMSSAEFSLVLSGFTLGAGGAVWIAGVSLLCGRVRIGAAARAGWAAAFALLFGCCLVLENIPFRGRGYVYSRGDGDVAFFEAENTAVLVIDADATLALCNETLLRRYAGTLDAVVVVGSDELKAINVAAALDTKCICARREIPTGLQRARLQFGDSASFGAFTFYFVGDDRLYVSAYGVSVELGFENSALGGDFFVPAGSGGLIFSFGDGIIKA